MYFKCVIMSKGEKRHFKKKKSGNWFVHPSIPKETFDIHPLTQVQRPQKTTTRHIQRSKCSDYPLSAHDNRSALQDCIDAYDQGIGRKKCPLENRQHNSPQELLYRLDDVEKPHTARLKKEPEGVRLIHRRFTKNHAEKSEANANAAAQAEERFMWFGREDSQQKIPLSVLAEANRHAHQ